MVLQFLDAGKRLSDVNRDIATGWATAVRAAIAAEADLAGVQTRQFACTLLVAVIAADQAIFLQVGDGGMVTMNDGGAVGPVFWPQNGEYANTTYFVTEADVETTMLFEGRLGCIQALAAFTDGVQSLALNYADRTAHAPFFEPLFGLLRDASDPAELSVPFRAFLDSKAVNDRTDDDKTLVIAVKVDDRGD